MKCQVQSNLASLFFMIFFLSDTFMNYSEKLTSRLRDRLQRFIQLTCGFIINLALRSLDVVRVTRAGREWVPKIPHPNRRIGQEWT